MSVYDQKMQHSHTADQIRHRGKRHRTFRPTRHQKAIKVKHQGLSSPAR